MDKEPISDGNSFMSVSHPVEKSFAGQCDACGSYCNVRFFPLSALMGLCFKVGIHPENIEICDLCASTYTMEEYANNKRGIEFRMMSTICYVGNEILKAIKAQKA